MKAGHILQGRDNVMLNDTINTVQRQVDSFSIPITREL